jgi:hypothetical protein
VWLDSVVADVRHTVRALVKARGFTATVLITLALGIGANTAVFTVLKTVLLDPLPYPDSDRIVNIGRRGGDITANIPPCAGYCGGQGSPDPPLNLVREYNPIYAGAVSRGISTLARELSLGCFGQRPIQGYILPLTGLAPIRTS